MQNHDTPAAPPEPSRLTGRQSPPEASDSAAAYLTLREAARQAGCGESTLRRLVKAHEIPFVQDETRTGFRYLFEPSVVPVIAHKASMRRPSGRPSVSRVGGPTLQPFDAEGFQEASRALQELSALRAERELLAAKNARLWDQVQRLTDSVTRLALPPFKPPQDIASEEFQEGGRSPRRTFWDWFFGRSERS